MTKTNVGAIQFDVKLPDITSTITEVFAYFYEALNGDEEYAMPFFNAWLSMQSKEGILAYYKKTFPHSND